MDPRRLSQLYSRQTGWVIPGLGQSEAVGVAAPQLHPGFLTLFKVRVGPGSKGEGMEVGRQRSRGEFTADLAPRVRLRRPIILMRQRMH